MPTGENQYHNIYPLHTSAETASFRVEQDADAENWDYIKSLTEKPEQQPITTATTYGDQTVVKLRSPEVVERIGTAYASNIEYLRDRELRNVA